MSEAPPPASSRPRITAPILVLLGLIVAGAAWMLPVNIKSVSPALLRAAGEGTPTLGAKGRDLIDEEKIGPASLFLVAAKATDDPRAPALAEALEKFAQRQPGLVAWGGWDPFLDPLFKLREDTGHRGSTPVINFLNRESARTTLR